MEAADLFSCHRPNCNEISYVLFSFHSETTKSDFRHDLREFTPSLLFTNAQHRGRFSTQTCSQQQNIPRSRIPPYPPTRSQRIPCCVLTSLYWEVGQGGVRRDCGASHADMSRSHPLLLQSKYGGTAEFSACLTAAEDRDRVHLPSVFSQIHPTIFSFYPNFSSASSKAPRSVSQCSAAACVVTASSYASLMPLLVMV